MKNFLNELSSHQLSIYEYLKSELTDDGENLISIFNEIEEGYDSVPERVHISFMNMRPVERVEVIHFATRYIMRKNA